jgi:hypothetical protein
MKVARGRASKTGIAYDRFAKRGRRRTVKRDLLSLLAVGAAIGAFFAAGRYARRRVVDAVQRQIDEIAQHTGITIEPGEVLLQGLTKVSISGTTVSFVAEGAAGTTVVRMPRIEAKANIIWVLLRRAFPLTVTIFDPQARVVRRADGTWELPLLEEVPKADLEGLAWDNIYSVIVRVRSGRLEIDQQGRGPDFCAERIDLSVRSSADRKAFRIRSSFSVPSISEDRLDVTGWVYPIERTFDLHTKVTALNISAIDEFIAGSFGEYIQGVVDGTIQVSGTIGKETAVRGPIAFSALNIGNTPEFMRDITGTADASIVINHENHEVLIEELAVDAGFARGALSGTLAYGASDPEVGLSAQFDRFPVEEVTALFAEQVYPTVSELCLVPGDEAKLAMELKGTVKEPEIALALSGPDSRATLNMETQPYGTVAADIGLAEVAVNWTARNGTSAELAVEDGTLRGERMPFTVTDLAGDVSFRNGLAATDFLSFDLDDVPVTVSGHAGLSPSGVRSADLTFKYATDDISENRYIGELANVNISGPADVTANLVKLDELVCWNVDADLTDAIVRSERFFHKPAGVNARLHLKCSIEGDGPVDSEVGLSLDEMTVAGHATVISGGPSAVTALTLELDELQLTNLMPCLTLPIDIVEDAGTKLVYVLNIKDGKSDVKAQLSADHVAIASEDDPNGESFMLEFDGFHLSLEEGERGGCYGDLRCRRAKISPPIPTLVKRGFSPEIMGQVASQVRIDANIEELVSEPYRAEQVRCAVLLSQSQLELASSTGHFAGGTFELSGSMVRDRGAYSLRWACEGLDVGQILSPVLEDSDKFAGEASANMSISGRFGVKSRSGGGSATVAAGRLDSSYIVAQMQGLDEVEERPPMQFDTMQCYFSLDNDTVNVSNLHLEKPGLVVEGQGTVTLDGRVDQLFTIEMSREVVDELFANRRKRLIELLAVPGVNARPVIRTFRMTGRFGELETEVLREPLHVELVRGTLGISERIAVAGVTVLALPARVFTDIMLE